ncbi:MAG: hypothetical protein ACE5JX_17080 [Acidobacteriota bacterium]
MKPELLLVDMSAWIGSFKKERHQPLQQSLRNALAAGNVVITELIILELLQGCRSVKERDLLSLTTEVCEKAYSSGFQLRRVALTIPVVDFILDALAMTYNCEVVYLAQHLKPIRQELPGATLTFAGQGR